MNEVESADPSLNGIHTSEDSAWREELKGMKASAEVVVPVAELARKGILITYAHEIWLLINVK